MMSAKSLQNCLAAVNKLIDSLDFCATMGAAVGFLTSEVAVVAHLKDFAPFYAFVALGSVIIMWPVLAHLL